MMGRLLDEAVALVDRLQAEVLREDRLQVGYWYANPGSQDWARFDRLRSVQVRAERRVERRAGKYFPA